MLIVVGIFTAFELGLFGIFLMNEWLELSVIASVKWIFFFHICLGFREQWYLIRITVGLSNRWNNIRLILAALTT